VTRQAAHTNRLLLVRVDRLSALVDELAERAEVPELECLVEGTGKDLTAARDEDNRVDRVAVSAELVEESTGLEVPDANDVIERAGGQEAVVG